MKKIIFSVLLIAGLYQVSFSQTNEKRPIASYKKEWKDTIYYKVPTDSIKNNDRPQISMYKNVVIEKDTVKRIIDKYELKKERETILKPEGKKNEND